MRAPAQPGDALEAVDTPALVVDLDALERNLARMQAWASARALRLRPHAKTHKCAEIAHRQCASGAVGVCCQKVSEAEALVARGLGDVLVTNEVVGEAKLARLAALARRARLGVLADDAANVAALAAACVRAGCALDVYVELDVGGGRCGVAPHRVAGLAREIARRPPLRFGGLHAYHGAAQHLRSPAERAQAVQAAAARVREALAALAAEGLGCPVVTGAGTGTFAHEAASGLWNELQPGSYVFMDADYARNDPGDAPQFEHALFVLATVMSRPAPGRAVLDAGLKATSGESGPPLVHGRDGLRCTRLSDEHCVVDVEPGARAPVLGEKLLLVPGHCDPTVNLHDAYVCVRAGRVEAIWPVDARGAVF